MKAAIKILVLIPLLIFSSMEVVTASMTSSKQILNVFTVRVELVRRLNNWEGC